MYIDDILFVGNDTAEITSVTAFLDSTFKIKDLGTLHYLLGLEFQKISDGIVVSQRKFTLDHSQEFDCLQAPSVVSPLDLFVKLLPSVTESIFILRHICVLLEN